MLVATLTVILLSYWATAQVASPTDPGAPAGVPGQPGGESGGEQVMANTTEDEEDDVHKIVLRMLPSRRKLMRLRYLF